MSLPTILIGGSFLITGAFMVCAGTGFFGGDGVSFEHGLGAFFLVTGLFIATVGVSVFMGWIK